MPAGTTVRTGELALGIAAAAVGVAALVDSAGLQRFGTHGPRRDGTILRAEVTHNRGTPDNPLTDTELAEEFTDVAASRLGAGQAELVLDQCWHADELTDFAVLVRASVART